MVLLPNPGGHKDNKNIENDRLPSLQPLQGVTSKDLLPRLLRVAEFVESFHGKRITAKVDATPLVSFAKDFGREDLLPSKKDPRTYFPAEFASLIGKLTKTFGISNGEIFVLNLMGAHYFVYSGQISFSTLVNHKYLNRTITEGLVSLRSPSEDSNFLGVTLESLALRDSQRCEKDARNIWKYLRSGETPLNNIVFFRQLKYIAQQCNFSEKDYIEIAGHNRQRFAFLQKVKDRAFGAAVGYNEPSGDWEHLLNPASILGREMKRSGEKLQDLTTEMVVTGYSSALGGLLMELATYQAAGKAKFGVAAVFDFLFEHAMGDQADSNRPPDEYYFKLNASKLLFKRLKTYSEELNPTNDTVMNMLWRENPEKTLENCMDIFSHIYSIDFLTDAERAEIVAKKDNAVL